MSIITWTPSCAGRGRVHWCRLSCFCFCWLATRWDWWRVQVFAVRHCQQLIFENYKNGLILANHSHSKCLTSSGRLQQCHVSCLRLLLQSQAKVSIQCSSCGCLELTNVERRSQERLSIPWNKSGWGDPDQAQLWPWLDQSSSGTILQYWKKRTCAVQLSSRESFDSMREKASTPKHPTTKAFFL